MGRAPHAGTGATSQSRQLAATCQKGGTRLKMTRLAASRRRPGRIRLIAARTAPPPALGLPHPAELAKFTPTGGVGAPRRIPANGGVIAQADQRLLAFPGRLHRTPRMTGMKESGDGDGSWRNEPHSNGRVRGPIGYRGRVAESPGPEGAGGLSPPPLRPARCPRLRRESPCGPCRRRGWRETWGRLRW